LVLEHWLVGVRLMFPSQDVCCTPVFLVDYKSSREAELIVYAAHLSGIVSRTVLMWRNGLFYEPHYIDKCFLSRGISIKELIAISSSVCVAIIANWPTIFRVVFSDASPSFQLLEIPERREAINKKGLLGRVFRKKHFSEDHDADFIVCSATDREGQFLLVVDSSGLFSLIDCNLLSCVAQMKYYKLAKREYCEIFPCKEERRFVVVLFVLDDYLSSSLHVVDIFIRSQDFTSGDENILQIQTRFSYHAPIHIQFGCYLEEADTLVVQDEEGRLFSVSFSSNQLTSSDSSDSLCAVFDYYSEWNDYGGLGWALDSVYEKVPIQMLFAPCRFSDDILAKVLKQPNYLSRMSLYSYACAQSFSMEDWKRLVISATRLSWETESTILSICNIDFFRVFVVMRQGYVGILRPMEVFETFFLQRDVETKLSSSQYDISLLPDIFMHSINYSLFSKSLLWNCLHVLFLQWVTALKAWKERYHVHKDALDEDFVLYYTNFPRENLISSSLIDEFVHLCLKKPLSSLFEYPLNIWLKDSCSFLEQGLNGYSLFFCLWKFFTPGPGIVVFLYDRKEWHLLLQVCEILKDRHPILSYGVGCWIYLRLQQVDLAESFLTRLLEALEETQDSGTETQLVHWITGVEQEPLSFWLREAFVKFLDRLGYTERAIRMGKEMISVAQDDSSIASIRTFVFNGYMKNREWKNALELLLSTIHLSRNLSSWTDDFHLLVHSLAEHRQLGLLYTVQVPPTLLYRIGEILYVRFQGHSIARQSLEEFTEYLLDSYRWYYGMKEFYLASRVAFEGYCKLLKAFDSISSLPWLRTVNRFIGMVCMSLSMIPRHEEQYLLLNGHLLDMACKDSSLCDWLSMKENQVGNSCKVEIELFRYISVVRGAQLCLLQHLSSPEPSSLSLLKLVDISSVKWLLSRLIRLKEWNLSFQVASQGSYLLLSDELLVLWFRLVGIYLMEQDSLEETLWTQLTHYLWKAESSYAKFCPDSFSYGHFGIVLLQGILSQASTQWRIPRWLLEYSGW